MGAAHEQARGEVSEELAQAEELEALAEAEARGDVESPLLHPARGSGRSEVFSVRLPEAAAAELRRRAEAEGVSAGVLLRQWALGALTGQDRPLLTHKQAELLFRETLQRAAEEAIESVADAAAATRTGINLGPRMVHRRLRERRSA